jgi:hypothetical protein
VSEIANVEDPEILEKCAAVFTDQGDHEKALSFLMKAGRIDQVKINHRLLQIIMKRPLRYAKTRIYV